MLAVAALVWWFSRNLSLNLAARGMQVDYGFLLQRAGFDIPFRLVDWDGSYPYGWALYVSGVNTLFAAALIIVLASLLGLLLALMRLSGNPLAAGTSLGLDEVAVNFYAGQGFLVKKALGVAKAADLQGATICTVTGATLELNIADFARSTGAKIGTLLFDKAEEAIAAMEAGRCDGYTDDSGSLAGMRSTVKAPNDWMVLPELISKEPLGLHIRSGDPRWQKIVFWVDQVLKSAEEFGVTRANADQMKRSSKDPFVLRLLGAESDFGKMLGLDNDWALKAIKTSGNYGEMYDLHFGPKALDLPRGMNNLYNKGGMHYTLPMR